MKPIKNLPKTQQNQDYFEFETSNKRTRKARIMKGYASLSCKCKSSRILYCNTVTEYKSARKAESKQYYINEYENV